MDRIELEVLKNQISDLRHEVKKSRNGFSYNFNLYVCFWFIFSIFSFFSIEYRINNNKKLIEKQYLKADSIHKATTEFYENFDFGKIIEEPPLC